MRKVVMMGSSWCGPADHSGSHPLGGGAAGVDVLDGHGQVSAVESVLRSDRLLDLSTTSAGRGP